MWSFRRVGKLIILPFRKSIETIGLPDMTITLVPGLPTDIVTTPPEPAPPVTPVPPVVGPPPDNGSSNFPVIDIHDRLPWAPENEDYRHRSLHTSLTFHWEGADPIALMSDEETVNYLVGVAIQHINKDWGNGQRGSGIMYHECIAQSGTSLVMREYSEIGWHAGNDDANLHSRGILVMCSKVTGPTPAQLRAVVKRFIDFGKVPVWPHRHWTPTECPGEQLASLVDRLRETGNP